MTTEAAYLLSTFGLFAIGAIDRALLKRRAINLMALRKESDDGMTVKFSVKYHLKSAMRCGQLTYTLRDKNNPTTVITGQPRPLVFSRTGINEEYLCFKKSQITSSGDWVLDVHASSTGSRINPFYKIFPLVSAIKQEFYLD